MSTYKVVHVSSISAPEAPLRLALDKGGIEELASSIREVGLLEPLIVKQVRNGFEVLAGHRRLLACRMAPQEMVPVMIVEGDDELHRTMMLAENVLRQDLSPVEEARAIRGMLDVLGMSVAEISKRMGKSEAWTRGRIELLTWPPIALEAIAMGRASVSALRPLMDIEDEPERDRLLSCAIESGATAVVTRSWAAGVLGMAVYMPDELSKRSSSAMPLAEYVVRMPCFGCREERPAIDLRVVRICDPCIDEITREAAALAQRTGERAQGGE